MRSLTQRVRLSLIVLLVAGPAVSAGAAPPSQALDAYVKAYSEMGKNAAVMFAQENTRANAQTNAFNAWVDAQCKILIAKSAWIKAVSEAQSTNAKTLQTLQQVRSLSLDNNLKVAKTFYEKRQAYDTCRGLHTRKRPTKEDVSRYAQVSLPKRPDNSQLQATRGEIIWPEVLLEEEFYDGRSRLESLFVQRNGGSSTFGGNVARQVQVVATQMREQLQAKIRQMTPAEYVAARKFLESLAYEARFPARIEGVARN